MGVPSGHAGRRADSSEIAHLLRRCRDGGDGAARRRLIELHLPLVESIARRYERGGDDIDDLVQAGSIGLIKAIDRFEPARGADFAAYAIPNITGEIQHHLRDRTSSVRVPRRLQELATRARSSQRDLAARLGREPTTAELAGELGSDESDLASALGARHARSPSSLAEALGAGDGTLDTSDARLDLAGALAALDDDERLMVRMRFVDGESNERIAREVGVSTRQLSRRFQRALGKLRARLDDEPDGDPLAAGSPRPKIAPMAAGAVSKTDLPYEVSLVHEEDGPDAPRWVARVEELPGCVAYGDTADAAARAASEAMTAWIEDAVARGAELPEPRRRSKHSGRLLLRMPQDLHAELAHKADREGVSLNGLIVGLLAGAVGWHRGDQGDERAGAASDSPPPARRGLLPVAIVANVVVVALAAALAIALLVVAWTHGW